MSPQRAEIKRPYNQSSVKARIEAFLLDNLGKVATREQIIEVSVDPRTGIEPENWHQRLSELRTDKGYTILTSRDRADLTPGEYLMPHAKRRETAGGRTKPTKATWDTILKQAGYRCVWQEDGISCRLRQGDIDPVGGGTVRLTPDHKSPHSIQSEIDPKDPSKWQPLCGRHQVMKKNYWDDETGKLNVIAIIQSSSNTQKKEAFQFLENYFRNEMENQAK